MFEVYDFTLIKMSRFLSILNLIYKTQYFHNIPIFIIYLIYKRKINFKRLNFDNFFYHMRWYILSIFLFSILLYIKIGKITKLD